jgi:endoglucanase
MSGQLSHALPRLTVEGNRIIEAHSRQPVLLRGVNRSGLEYSSPEGAGSLTKAGLSERDFDEMICEWHVNIIRLPFNQDWVLSREGYDAEPYLAALDYAIRSAAQRGAYTLLDLQWLDASTPCGTLRDGTANFVPCLPDVNSIHLWRQLARRYREEPAVLFDIFNEPHHPLADDRTTGTPVTMDLWQRWAALLIEAIRGEHESALIFVPGVDWAFDLRGHPLKGVKDVVYSTHVYPGKGRDWDRAFGHLCCDVPVFAGEWGGGTEDVEWGRELLAYMGARNMGWTAWSWSDKPRLVERSESGEYRPTEFGLLVKAALEDAA